MITVSEISKSFAGRTLFSGLSLQINRRDRIGVVGANGTGKSTLFSLILRQEEPDDGNIAIERAARLGHLPQETAPAGEQTVLELAVSLEAGMAAAAGRNGFPSEFGACAGSGRVPAAWEHASGLEREVKAKNILRGLGFRESDFSRPAKELSGGWVMRAHLARLLVQEPDALLLDEPTNHLDLETLLWFQEYLKTYPGAILVISHDREFLNELADSIVEIRRGQLIRYRGNFEAYVQQRAAHEAQVEAAYKNQQREIERLMRFVDRFRAKNTKASQAQAKLKQIGRMEKIEAPAAEEKEIRFSFPQPPRSGLRVIQLAQVDHAYGSNVIYRGLHFEAERGQRIVLVGPNGAGKSTLLKLLAGVLPVQSGKRQLGHNVKAGYYSQYRLETLDPSRSVLEEALDTPQRVTEQFVRTLLGGFLFRGDDIFKKVSVLSGGEKSRLALVKLLLDPPNLLLMDEPTTHLDLASIDALLDALDEYSGTLIFISHDVYFIRALANHMVHVQSGRLRHYPGDYQYYLDKTAEAARAALTSAAHPGNAEAASSERPGAKAKDQKRREAEDRQARSRLRKEQQGIVQQLENKIHQLESKQVELAEQLQQPETYGHSGAVVKLNCELAELLPELKRLTEQWEVEAHKLAQWE